MMRLTFEAMTARDLFKQIADFIEIGAGTPEASKPVTKSPASMMASAIASTLPKPPKPVSVQAAEKPETSSKPPTPAVIALLKQLGVPENEWDNVPRTGKDGRMTQGDAKAYAAEMGAGAVQETEEPVQSPGTKDADVRQPEEKKVSELTTEVVSAKMRELYQAADNGRELCFGILQPYGTVRIPEIDPEHYPTIYEKVEAELEKLSG